MAYSLVSAANPKALLAALVTFAGANGWTVEFDDSTGAGGIGGQIGLSSGNCHVAIGEENAAQNPVAVTGGLGPQNDGRVYMALSESINPALKRFWGQPGSIVTAANTGSRLRINDVWGPMDEVHFFGNSEYIIVNVRCSSLRWTCFGFGQLDTLGMTCPKAGFAFSNYHAFWDTEPPLYNAYNLIGTSNSFAMDPSRNNNVKFWIPDGILDPSFGLPDGAFTTPNLGSGERHRIVDWCRLDTFSESLAFGASKLLDQAMMTRNQPTTGGIALHALPVIYRDLTTNFHTFLGNIPALRMVRMPQNAPGDIVTYGTEEYMLFPWKQKGTVANTPFNGGTPNFQPNTYDYGWAILKN